MLVGGVLFVTLHSVSDIGIYALLGGKVAKYSAQHDPGLSYTLYLLTFALDSVADIFGSLFMLGTGLLVLRSRPLPRWLGWVAILSSPFLFLQGFGLGGVVSKVGLGEQRDNVDATTRRIDPLAGHSADRQPIDNRRIEPAPARVCNNGFVRRGGLCRFRHRR